MSEAVFVVSAGADRGRRFTLAHGRISIGRAMDNDIVLTDIAVSRKHVVIEFDGAHYLLTDLGSGNGTLVNGRDEEGTHRLLDGDRLELGNTVLEFQSSSSSAAAMARGAAPELWPREDDEPSTLNARKSRSAIGRSRSLTAPPEDRAAPPRRIITAPPFAPAQTLPPEPRFDEAVAAPSIVREPAALASLPPAAVTVLAAEYAPSGGDLPPAGSFPPAGALPPATIPPATIPPASIPPASAHPMSLGGSTGTGAGYPSYRASATQAQAPSLAGGALFLPTGMLSGAAQIPYQAPAARGDRKRMLLAFVGVALLAAGGGVAVALIRGGRASAGATDSRSAAGADRGGGAANPSTSSPAMAAAASGDPTEPPTLASLTTGTRALPLTAFGTDEGSLVGAAAGRAAEPENDERPPDKELPPETFDDEQPGGGTAATTRSAERGKQGGNRGSPVPEGVGDEPEDDAPTVRGEGGDARAQAANLYGDMKFAEAAALLRRAARKAGRGEAGRLTATASNYEKVGNILAQARGGDQAEQLKAYKSALRADEQAGDAVHQDFIESKLALIAPRVAGSHMAAKRYAEAKLACDDAERYGAGRDVARVRESLERKAQELAAQATELARRGKEDDAADLVDTIVRMVPRTSTAYSKATALTE